MSTFIIQVNGAAYSSSGSYNAYRFAKAALEAGHNISRVFFYQDGVFNTSSFNNPAADEFNLRSAWVALNTQYHTPLVNCVSAALRRGIISPTEACETGGVNFNMRPPFEMAGLGELVTGIEKSDRLVSF